MLHANQGLIHGCLWLVMMGRGRMLWYGSIIHPNLPNELELKVLKSYTDAPSLDETNLEL